MYTQCLENPIIVSENVNIYVICADRVILCFDSFLSDDHLPYMSRTFRSIFFNDT